jgi:hypothetical protein
MRTWVTWALTTRILRFTARPPSSIFFPRVYAGNITALNRAWHEHANYASFASEEGGWGVGRGLADEDGTCPSKSSSAVGECWLGSGTYRENSNLADVRPALLADMDAYLVHHVAYYLQSMRGAIAQHVPGRMYWGPTTLGGWGAPARGAVYQAAGQHLDAVGVGLGGATASDFEARLAFVRTHLGVDVPLVNWEGFKAQDDSSMQAYDEFAAVRPHSDSQETRGVRYQQVLQSVLLSRAPGEHVFPFIGIKWWELYDSSKEVANWGLVTRLGNAYDGAQARAGAQACSADALVVPGWECGGEAADYGDMLTSVQEANALSLWIAAEAASMSAVAMPTPATPNPTLAPTTSPTAAPTATPTSAPTAEPTMAGATTSAPRTAAPTQTPTPAPSDMPASAATAVPTSPTAAPTADATAAGPNGASTASPTSPAGPGGKVDTGAGPRGAMSVTENGARTSPAGAAASLLLLVLSVVTVL